jgi:hypothetical protein
MRRFENCDSWWGSLSPIQKMWIHRMFPEQPDDSFFVGWNHEKMLGYHNFNLRDRDVSCDGLSAVGPHVQEVKH